MSLLNLFIEAGNLKKLRRSGWVLRGIPNPESIADHSFRTALITLFLADELRNRGVDVDVEKAVKMALLHDLGEARITDIPMPAQGYFDKVSGERKALRDILKPTKRAEEYLELFEEYESESTLEGKLVKFADKLEMLVQACEYERAGFNALDEFWGALESLRKSDLYPHFKDVIEGLVRARKQNCLL
ncbi:oxetanocin [Thermococcus profundus]|uniref:5'-deoxynucleotidase n=1 Tax=Thermococcus profundus TaxID=49899 RepID=A0A2Z2MGD2_THEPR|nr:HD family hydrolase [Thermococcus profundus]ASJ02954.1 oxetanocin [Thermococcus profundus]